MKLIVAEMVSVPGREAELEAALRDVVAATRPEPGCLAFDCSRDLDDAGRFVLVEEWADSDAIRAHATMPHLAQFRAAVDGVIARQSVRLHDVDRSRTL